MDRDKGEKGGGYDWVATAGIVTKERKREETIGRSLRGS